MKKTLAFILALCLFVGLCACGAQEAPATTTADVPTVVTAAPTTEPTVPPTEPIVVTEMIKGETYTLEDGSTFIVEATDWTYDLVARINDHSTLSIGSATDGNIIYYLKLKYQNNAKTRFDYMQYSTWETTLIYGDGYEYSGFASTVNDLDPLMSGEVYIVFKVPEPFKTDGKAMQVSLCIGEERYSFNAREAGEAVVVDPNLVPNEMRVIENKGEITFVNAYTTKKLLPPKASGWYTYYEASEGYTYVVCEFVVKNLGMDITTDDGITGYATVDGQKVDGFCVMASRDQSDFGNYRFEVLAEHVAFFIIELPDDKLGAEIAVDILFADERFVVPYSGA